MAVLGELSKAQDNLRTQLADSSEFRTLVGAANQAQALDDIYQDVLPDPADGVEYTQAELIALRPYALIGMSDEDGFSFEHVSTGTSYDFTPRSTLELWIVRDLPSGEDGTTADLTWRNIVLTIMEEIADLAGQAGYLAFTGIDLIALHRNHPDLEPTQGDNQLAMLRVVWGGGAG